MERVTSAEAPAVSPPTWWSGLQIRLIVAFSVTFGVILFAVEGLRLFGIPGTPVVGRIADYRREVGRTLDLIADLKEDRLRWWIDERLRDLSILSSDYVYTDTLQSLHDRAIALRQSGADSAETATAIRGSDEYVLLHAWLDRVADQFPEYERLLIVDAESGVTLASSRSSDVGSDKGDRDYVKGALLRGGDYVSPVTRRSGDGLPVMEFSRPITIEGGSPIAVLLIEVAVDQLLRPILHTGEALGETGEALLVDNNVRTVTTLRHPLADGSIARPLEYEIRAEPARRAAKGGRDLIEAIDYRGHEVLAAYRHVDIAPGVSWGLVVKRDMSEVSGPFWRGVAHLLALVALGLLASVLTTVFIARSLTRPLRELGHAAERVADGDLGVQADIHHRDEVGLVAAAFNKMVERLRAAQVQLLRQERMAALGQLTASVSHELRNPLGTIRTALYLIGQKTPDGGPQVKASLERAERAIQRCDTIVGDLLDFGRSRELRPHPVEVDPWLRRLLDEYPKPNNIRFESRLTAGITVSLDHERMEQCILNLLDNAREAVLPHGGSVCLTSEVEDQRLRITVADSGCGIPPEDRQRVFEPLYSTKTFGVGLGLPIVRQIVEQHGGEVRVASEIRGGTEHTVFTIEVPTRPERGATIERTTDLRG
ncbi:MAG: ATP-binding protein [Planctomycetota bacterium]